MVQASFPSSTTGTPRRKVATTRPGSSIPAKGVFRLAFGSGDFRRAVATFGSGEPSRWDGA